jgi:COP9 signalosome complex subunit 7
MPTIRDLEDLIIDAIYLDILRGKLDQKEQQLEIEYTMGRDLEPGKAEAVLAALKTWCVLFQLLLQLPLSGVIMVFSRASTTASVLSALDNKLAQISSYSAAVAVDNEEHDRAYNAILKDVSKDTKKRGPLTAGGNIMRGGVDLADAMDVDEEPRMKGRK